MSANFSLKKPLIIKLLLVLNMSKYEKTVY